MKSIYINGLAIFVITIAAFWLRFANLDTINLFNDEYYQFETAVSLVETGEYKRYNFYTQQPEVEYTRSKLFTQQIAQSFRLFGISETSARLPAVLWGTLLIPLVILVLLRTTSTPFLAYGVGTLLLFDDFFIAMSRFTRMYTMVFVLTVIIVWLLYEAMQLRSIKWRSGALVLAILITAALYSIFPELAMLLWFGVAAYIGLRTLAFVANQQDEDKLFVHLFIAGSALSVIGVLVHSAGWHFIPVDAFGVRIEPHLFYISELFAEIKLPALGLLFLVLGLIRMRNIKKFEGFTAVIAFTVLIFFVYFGQRWEATRYIGFIIPFIYLLMVSGMYQLAKWGAQAAKLPKSFRVPLAAGILVIGGVWLSFPGVPAWGYITQSAYADRGYDEVNRPNMEYAYQHVIANYTSGQTVFMQGPRYYYWTDVSIPVVELGAYKSMSYAEFLDAIYAAETGGMVVYNTNKARHLNDEIKNFVSTYMVEDKAIAYTKVQVYSFTPELLPQLENTIEL